MFIRIEPSSGIPITRQIADQIRAQCASGVLARGERLPSIRALARELDVNQNTILRVYERLTGEGLVERRHGDGTYVAASPPSGQLGAQLRLLRKEAGRLAQRAAVLGLNAAALQEVVNDAFERLKRPSIKSKERRNE